jgi:hypothetical protein
MITIKRGGYFFFLYKNGQLYISDKLAVLALTKQVF